ncbi:TonB-dependent receptor [Sphingomonas sp. Root50]|nr:TonB-dependent receptor [Sphingomonas sp. Root1294]KQY68240.1 TonB-dependent receptor [Sphingomonas sp. Root50]KRB91137.1 TonB-dependent receptor [Sphingomonas sp. Root720]
MDDVGVNDIVVTATRRATNLQDTPVAVSAVDRNIIDQAAPRDISDLAAYVPNFSAARITAFPAASFAMRGVAQTDANVYNDPPVAVLIDDFVVPTAQGHLLDTFDIAQIEVLRGPQGTLFGKNTTGGAVVVHTKHPDLEGFGAEARGLIGSFGTYKAQASLNLPISEGVLALRLVGGYEKSDGFMRNGYCYGPLTPLGPSPFAGATGCGDGKRVGGQDIASGRAKLLWKPSDSVSALLQYEILRDSSDATPTVSDTPAGDPTFLFNLLGLGANSGNPHKRAGVSNRRGFLVGVGAGQTINVDGIYLNVDVETDAGTFTSVSGYRSQRSRLPGTFPGVVSPVSAFDGNRSDDHKTFQQEIRFSSSFEGPFQVVAGGFYQNDKTDFCVGQVLGFLDLAGVTNPYGPFNTNPQVLCNNQRASSWAGFAEGTYDITDKLKFIAGFRYTVERKRWTGRNQVFVQDLKGVSDPSFTWEQLGGLMNAGDFKRYPTGVLTDKQTWKEPTWRASLSYQFTDDIFGYGTFTRGFKSGAYNDQTGTSGAPLVPDQIRPTDPEIAESYEAGVRTQFFDRRLTMNVTGFLVDYKNMQRQVVVPVTRPDGSQFQEIKLFNAAAARVKGIEAESVIRPTSQLTLRGVLGYQDAKYRSFVSPLPTGRDLADSPVTRAPKWQLTGAATYQVPLGDWKLLFNGTVTYQASNAFTIDLNNAAFDSYLDARTLVNASITLAQADDRYFARLIARNLTNVTYKTASQTVSGLWIMSNYGEPRFLGLELGVKLGNK